MDSKLLPTRGTDVRQREVLPHERVHVEQQEAPQDKNRHPDRAETEAQMRAPNLRDGLPVHTEFMDDVGEQQGIIWWVVAGVAAIWFFSGERVANAPGYRRDREARFLRDERGSRCPFAIEDHRISREYYVA